MKQLYCPWFDFARRENSDAASSWYNILSFDIFTELWSLFYKISLTQIIYPRTFNDNLVHKIASSSISEKMAIDGLYFATEVNFDRLLFGTQQKIVAINASCFHLVLALYLKTERFRDFIKKNIYLKQDFCVSRKTSILNCVYIYITFYPYSFAYNHIAMISQAIAPAQLADFS